MLRVSLRDPREVGDARTHHTQSGVVAAPTVLTPRGARGARRLVKKEQKTHDFFDIWEKWGRHIWEKWLLPVRHLPPGNGTSRARPY